MKLYIIRAIALAFVLAVTSSCFRQDRRTITIRTPQVKSGDCLLLMQNATKSVDGIEYVQQGTEEGTVEVTYNALKLGIRNIEFVIAGAGFDANDTKAPPAAREALPEGCR